MRGGDLRRGLLERASASRAAERLFTSVRRDEGEWRALAKGVRVKMLYEGPRSRSLLVDLGPGAVLPRQPLPELEECVVLRGEAQLGDLRMGQGDYHLAPRGRRLGSLGSHRGATVYFRSMPMGGACAAPITVRANEGEWRDFAPRVQSKLLWRNAEAHSLLLRLEPGARVAAHDHPLDEECLMLDGEAFFDDLLLRAGEFQLAPAGTQHGEVTTDVGALLYVYGAAGA